MMVKFSRGTDKIGDALGPSPAPLRIDSSPLWAFTHKVGEFRRKRLSSSTLVSAPGKFNLAIVFHSVKALSSSSDFDHNIVFSLVRSYPLNVKHSRWGKRGSQEKQARCKPTPPPTYDRQDATENNEAMLSGLHQCRLSKPCDSMRRLPMQQGRVTRIHQCLEVR